MLEDGALSELAAIPTPLPPVSEDDVFSAEQWAVLLAICEVFLPSITPSTLRRLDYDEACAIIENILPQSAHKNLAESYLAETVAGQPKFKEAVRRRFVAFVPREQARGLAFLLSALNTRPGSLIATGSTTALHLRPLAVRTRAVLSWPSSYIGPLRALYKVCESLTKAIWLSQSRTLHQVIDYPEIPKGIERHPSYDFKFIDFSGSQTSDTIELSSDIIIVGSGCGSGVVADHLARSLSDLVRKPRILLLEKAYHFPATHFPMEPSSASFNMQEAGGGLLSDDGSIFTIAASVFGGGGIINWSASLQPQHFVREDWARQTKLPMFLSPEFQACLDQVCDRMGVCRAHDYQGLAQIEHNYGNRALLEGARRLGLTAEVVPQNVAGKRHYCGRCFFGCAAATKQGPANLWLPSAAKNGVEFIEGCFVDKVVWDEATSSSQGRRAIGVKATWTSRDRACTKSLFIKANTVIVASGTLHSPLILHRSGLTPEFNKHIGSNLHLHPVVCIRGTYRDRVDPWDGTILTSAMTSLENTDGKGHGVKIEVLLGTPDLTGAALPFRPSHTLQASAGPNVAPDEAALKTALDYKLRVAKHGHSFAFIAIHRDHADGLNSRNCYVYNDAEDARKVRICYTPSVQDRMSLLEGLITGAKMHYVMGAETVEVLIPSIETFDRSPPSKQSAHADDTAFENWIANIRSKGVALLDKTTTRLGSAHQMSTCRMSSSPEEGVVDINGRVWGTSNVYVADASILPSASGVNPMVSTMGLSLHVAKSIEKQVKDSWN